MPPGSKTAPLDPLAFGKVFLTSNPEIGLLVADRVAHNPELAVLEAMTTVYRVHLLLCNPDRAAELVANPGDAKALNEVARRAPNMVRELQRLYEIAVEKPAEQLLPVE